VFELNLAPAASSWAWVVIGLATGVVADGGRRTAGGGGVLVRGDEATGSGFVGGGVLFFSLGIELEF